MAIFSVDLNTEVRYTNNILTAHERCKMTKPIFQEYSKEAMHHIDELIYYAECVQSGKALSDFLEQLENIKEQYQDYLEGRDPLVKFVLSKEEAAE